GGHAQGLDSPSDPEAVQAKGERSGASLASGAGQLSGDHPACLRATIGRFAGRASRLRLQSAGFGLQSRAPVDAGGSGW
ncbi:MAG TPA: hypothetical protein PKC26_10775, partial [Plasticicumulans sp.]|nr:hypothetical protein [Plasticicumulans sp.]